MAPEHVPFSRDARVSVREIGPRNEIIRDHPMGIVKNILASKRGKQQIVVLGQEGLIRVPWPEPKRGQRKIIRYL
ncbi:MAG: hypothetical protein AAB573_01755 [Patescibacteria group bacterium]